MPVLKTTIHSIELAIVRVYPDGTKVTDHALVRPAPGSFAQYGDAPGHVAAENRPLLERIAHAAWMQKAADAEAQG